MDNLRNRVQRHINYFPSGSLRLAAAELADGDIDEQSGVQQIEQAIDETLTSLIRAHAIVSDDDKAREALLSGLMAYRKAREQHAEK